MSWLAYYILMRDRRFVPRPPIIIPCFRFCIFFPSSDRQNQKILEESQTLRKKAEEYDDALKAAQLQIHKLETDLQRLKESKACRICMDSDISQVFIPCGHTISCQRCIGNIKTCPICRRNISGSMIAYFWKKITNFTKRMKSGNISNYISLTFDTKCTSYKTRQFCRVNFENLWMLLSIFIRPSFQYWFCRLFSLFFWRNEKVP